MNNIINEIFETELVNSYMVRFPNEYNAIFNLALYDKKIKHHIDTHYHPDEIYNLFKTVEYYKELDNVENGIYNQTPFAQYAQKRMSLFKIMCNATYQFSLRYGRDNARKMIGIITNYVNDKIHISNIII